MVLSRYAVTGVMKKTIFCYLKSRLLCKKNEYYRDDLDTTKHVPFRGLGFATFPAEGAPSTF